MNCFIGCKLHPHMKSQIQVFLFFLLISFGYAQPKLSFDLGLGIYQPTLTGYDENNTFPVKIL